jgi:hypothetical protein
MPVSLTFLGGAGTVTGSKYLVRHGGQALMVDCGLFQGYKLLRQRNWRPLPVAPQEIDAVTVFCRQRDRYAVALVVPFGSASGEINLVIDGDTRQRRRELGENRALRIADTDARIDQQHDDVGPLDLAPGAFNADLFDRVIRIAQPGGINHVQRNTIDLKRAAHDVARGAGNRRYDR